MRHRTGGLGAAARPSHVASTVAVVAVVVAPLLAGALSRGSPVAMLALPAETIAAILLLLSITTPWLRALVAGAFGAVTTLALVVGALDLGFVQTIDRGFNPVEDGGAVVSAVGVVADATSPATATMLVGLVLALVVALAAGLAAAALRVGRPTAEAAPVGRYAVAGAAVVWMGAALAGLQVAPGVPFAAEPATTVLAGSSVRAVHSAQDEEAFEHDLGADPLAATAPRLGALAGKDVVFVFVESYGEAALRDASFTDGIAQTLRDGQAQLARDGYSARSALLTSPTFGGVSWLAHATLQSGMWVDSQLDHDRLMTGDRRTLTSLFGDAGWRTVAVVPSNTGDWPSASDFYGFDTVLDARTLGYRGPSFSYARVPDQFTLQRFHQGERGRDRPVMAEIDLVSSHTPWTPIPRLVPWSRLGDGSVFASQPAGQPSPVQAWTDPARVREQYAQAIRYSLATLFSYLRTYDGSDLVLVVVGDHQPARIVSGADADRDVPVTIIAQDAAVFERISSWGWEPGVHPSPAAPVWRMDEFRDRFVGAFTP